MLVNCERNGALHNCYTFNSERTYSPLLSIICIIERFLQALKLDRFTPVIWESQRFKTALKWVFPEMSVRLWAAIADAGYQSRG